MARVCVRTVTHCGDKNLFTVTLQGLTSHLRTKHWSPQGKPLSFWLKLGWSLACGSYG